MALDSFRQACYTINMTTSTTTIETLDAYGTPTPEATAKILSRVANVRSEDFAVIADLVTNDHRTLQQGIAGFALQLVNAFANNADAGRVDARNEYSAQVCQQLRDVMLEIGLVRADGTMLRMPCI